MFENRNLASDLFALGLLVVTVFVGISLLTYDPADPVGEPMTPLNRIYAPDIVVYPQNESVANGCGRWGAYAADLLFTALGVCAYYLLISLAVLDYHLLRRREIDTPVVRAIGWVASIVGLGAIVAILAPGISPGPVIGSARLLGRVGQSPVAHAFRDPGQPDSGRQSVWRRIVAVYRLRSAPHARHDRFRRLDRTGSRRQTAARTASGQGDEEARG